LGEQNWNKEIKCIISCLSVIPMTGSARKFLLPLLAASCVLSNVAVFARTLEDTAEMLSRSGHRDDAIRVITDAIKKSPKAASLYSTRAKYYIAAEQYELGLADLKKAVALEPNAQKAWLYRMMADCDANLERFDAAIGDLKKAIAVSPHEEYYKMLGEINYQLKRYDEAIECFTKGIALNKTGVWLYKGRGDVYFQQHKYQKAADDYTNVIRINPKEPMGYGARAKAYERLGRKDLAAKDYAKGSKDVDFMTDVLR